MSALWIAHHKAKISENIKADTKAQTAKKTHAQLGRVNKTHNNKPGLHIAKKKFAEKNFFAGNNKEIKNEHFHRRLTTISSLKQRRINLFQVHHCEGDW